MKILAVHNSYRQPGGEDAVFADEVRLLREHGHKVIEYLDTNKRIDALGPARSATGAVWSREAYQRIQQLIREQQPDAAHFHGTFLVISPSAYFACKQLGLPVVQTLHNYRLMCPAATLFRTGAPCEDCMGKLLPWPAVQHACYRHSRPQSAVVAAMLAIHRGLRTWQERVDLYVALTEFSRAKFIESGIGPEKIVVKPNFVFDVPKQASPAEQGSYVLYAGRLSIEKGLLTALRAWEGLPDVPLVIAGDGPLRGAVTAFVDAHPQVSYVGLIAPAAARDLIKNARFLILPSLWYEVFPRVIVESFSGSRAVVTFRIGVMRELVRDGETGLLAEPGSAESLAGRVRWLWGNPELTGLLGRNARREYEQKYTSEQNYRLLMQIYSQAVGGRLP